MVKRKDTEFWKKVTNLEPPKTLKENLKKWKNRLPVNEDFKETNYYLFFEQNWASVLWGLDLFDKKSIKKEYDSYPINFCNFVENDIKNWENYNKNSKINHKEFLELYRKAN